MIFITSESEIQNSFGLTALYFYASWMPGHKKMCDMIEKVNQHYPGIKSIAIDIEYFKNQCIRFKIESIPTVIIFKDGGKEINRILGRPMLSAFKKVFGDICTSYEAEKTKNHGDSNEKK